MKFVLICMLGITISSLGLMWVKKILGRINQLEQIILSINFIRQEISYSSAETLILFKKLNYKYPELFPFDCSYPSEFIDKTIQNENLLLCEGEREDLKLFLLGIGKTDVSGQLEHSRVYLKKFEKHLSLFRDKSSNKIKVYPTLSILVGLMCVVLLV